ncbi:hypothetical protein NLJ89_g124 [Agrocybe chaxingu]|uniref:Chromatin target of PRMT1 protein C-terminal domain-containing protein n=1 Tax=Agrocybe chaxingu TaxID=84603 RepID=A0A9W8N2G2_9AGAR|nr:hypothetical protein NLJ89_g124 [Agrocybe chaxingu]
MDSAPDGIAPQESEMLSYDDDVAYEKQLPTEAERAAQAASFAQRIGISKVYLLSESSAAARAGKGEDGEEDADKIIEDEDMDEDTADLSYRPNAILVTGPPIAHLPTARLFAYATHFDAHPLGLEWVDDNTCVFVFDSLKAARAAFSHLQKTISEEPDMDEYLTAKPFPIALWPAEERLKQTLGQGEGLKGRIRMRWARPEDVKKKGAKNESQFYKKHGEGAGKELFDGRELPPAKRRRRDPHEDDERRRAELDDELDAFLAESGTDDERSNANAGRRRKKPKLTDRLASSPRSRSRTPEEAASASPPSKMRSDYIASDGRTLLQRTSLLRLHSFDEPSDLASRLTAPLPRRARRRGGRGDRDWDTLSPVDVDDVAVIDSGRPQREWDREKSVNGHERPRERTRGGRDRRTHRERGGDRPVRTAERPRKTQQELDDELDAFLRGHD